MSRRPAHRCLWATHTTWWSNFPRAAKVVDIDSLWRVVKEEWMQFLLYILKQNLFLRCNIVLHQTGLWQQLKSRVVIYYRCLLSGTLHTANTLSLFARLKPRNCVNFSSGHGSRGSSPCKSRKQGRGVLPIFSYVHRKTHRLMCSEPPWNWSEPASSWRILFRPFPRQLCST